MSAMCARECEVNVRRILLNIQSSADLSEAASLYEEAKALVATGLQHTDADRAGDIKRGLLALALYVHMAYRTKEADAKGVQRVLCVR